MIQYPEGFDKMDSVSQQQILNGLLIQEINKIGETCVLSLANLKNEVSISREVENRFKEQLVAISRRLELLEDSKMVAVPKTEEKKNWLQKLMGK